MLQDLDHITVCICTYKRAHLLKCLLEKLDSQKTDGRFIYSIVVVDNDFLESAKDTVSDFAMDSDIPILYRTEPEQNIALARNKALENANGDFVAFIDDDELPPASWLLTLYSACTGQKVEGVLGPVKPVFEREPPEWLVRGKFCERPVHKTSRVLNWQETRTGNVLFRRRILAGLQYPFRREFGNGGEDDEFFKRMIEKGCVFTWCNEAVVHEVVPPERLKRRYLLKRALLRGQNQKHFATWRSVTKSIVAFVGYMFALPLLVFFGQHAFMNCLVKMFDHAGKLLAVVGLKPLGDKYNL